MSLSAFLGVRGSGDFVTDQRPLSWRQQILQLYPNGDAPLTAILSMAGSSAVDDPTFNWWDETIEAASGTITGRYTTSALSTSYASGATTGDTIYFKMSEADSKLARAGHQILLRDASDYTVDVIGKVTASTQNGSSSYLTVKLLENDDNSTAGDLSDADTFIIVGNINEEGASMPTGIQFNPVKHTNYTQIFRTALDITRTAQKTKLRTNPQAYQRMKAQALERHGFEMELAFWFGKATEGTGDGGKPERTTQGLIDFIKSNTYAAATNICNFSVDADVASGFDGTYNGKTWIAAGGGIDWLNEMLERIFRYGSSSRLAMCGPGALLGIQRLVSAHGTIQLQPVPKVYGMNVMSWQTPFGSIELKVHPLWRKETTMRNAMILFEPENLEYRYIDDTQFYDDPKGNNAGSRRVDGKSEEFLTECGLEMHHPETCGILYGVGKDNA